MHLSGKLGKITLSGADFHVTSWETVIETEALETTDTGDAGNRTYISGLTGGNGTYEANWLSTDPLTNKYSNIHRGAQAAATFLLGNSIDTLSGTIQHESITISSEAAGLVTTSASFVFSGAITVPT